MRVLIQADMEGVAHITDVRQILPLWPDYWRVGRRRLTDEVAATALGLMDGGISEIVIDDQHLGGPKNLRPERLPDGVNLPESNAIYHQLKERAFDAVFQVGRHSRWGTNTGFIAHTQMPGVSFALDGRPFTESHICAWRASAPVLGITGDDQLAAQLDGGLAGTPFLAVKRSRSLTETCPVEPTQTRTLVAIRDFAAHCAQDWRARNVAALPERFTLSAHLAPELAERLDGQHGLALTGRAILALHCEDWWRDAEPAMQAATYAVAQPLSDTLRTLDLNSFERLTAIDESTLCDARHLFIDWLNEPEKIWNE